MVVLNEAGEGYDSLENGINKAHRDRVFYLEGGLKGYEKFLEFKMLASRPKKERLKSTEKCEPCEKEAKEKLDRITGLTGLGKEKK